MIPQTVLEALEKHFGYTQFRPSQEPVVEHLLRGKDCLAIMPTGAGKSLCFQVPALLRKGLTIVFTPLISLMKDQVDGLRLQRIPATFINSTLDVSETNKRLWQIRSGAVKLLYIAPERLESESFCNFLRQVPISQVVIDEAHCVSQWGHDFRPSYGNIADFVASLPRKPIVAAFTATATREVEEDVKRLLGLEEATVFIAGFDRPNLTFRVVHDSQKMNYVMDYVTAHKEESGIIYCATRKDVEQVYKNLVKQGIKAGYYHGGLTDDVRKKEQERFAFDEVRVMVATNAFGMGIDKSNVRYVIHYQMPRNMEGYYQEAGRAGRDGSPGECILLYSGRDVLIQKFLIEQSITDVKRQTYELDRLQDMTDYCFTSECLRKFILKYFGEEVDTERCKNCSTCFGQHEAEDMTEQAEKVFKAIAFTEERYGTGMIVDILLGRYTDRIGRCSFDRTAHFGALETMSEKDLKGFIKMLVATGYVTVSGGKYPLLSLGAGAEDVLRGKKRVVQVKPENISRGGRLKSSARQARGQQPRRGLFAHLQEFRRALAQKEKVPPYLIFPDTVLIDMARERPQTLADLYTLKGVGEVKLQKYGLPFLAAIQDYKES